MSAWAAPGRVNLIGEHVDYNEGLVLPFAVHFMATARVTARADNQVHVRSTEYDQPVTFSLQVRPGEVTGWAAYVAGVIWALSPGPGEGVDIELHSDVPVGAGLSSSAAVACAVAAAVADELRLGYDPVDLAARCRRAENDFVGVPTGVMDQQAAMFCRAGHALLVDCRTLARTDVPLDLPGHGLRLLAIDTGVRHELAATGYAERWAECRAAAAALGLDSLRHATLADLGRIDDAVVRRRAHHVVTETARVREVVAELAEGRPNEIGAFLTASHESLRDDYGVSCAELDVTVDAALAAGALGARMTGGGFGGYAIALCREADVSAVIERVKAAYGSRGWRHPTWWVATPARGAHPLE